MSHLLPSEGLGTPDEEVLPGVVWGHPDQLFTPAYWKSLCAVATIADAYYNPAVSLTEHVVFCLLGGYGITAELNDAAFRHLKIRGLLDGFIDSRHLEEALLQPLTVSGRSVRYRFPRQRGRRIAAALAFLECDTPPEVPLSLREWLLEIEGVGYKTASWIVRNLTASDDVAILDVHVIRACQIIGIFEYSNSNTARYQTLEHKFLSFARAIGASAAILDAVMWKNMRSLRIAPLA